ncbi:MAG: hypothetical protein K8H84_13780 [Sulfuricella denitrificans]|nr:hypothetical protein [Sulfuricella denitrificans]
MSEAASLPVLPPGEIRLWWPIPLAAILWLLIVWGLGHFLASPRIEIPAAEPVEASFVELPAAPAARSPEAPKAPPAKSRPVVKPRHEVAPRPKTEESKPPAPAPEPAVSPPTDMLSYVNAARARRLAAERPATGESAETAARERGSSAEEARMANIMKNLQPQGTNGVIQIISMGIRTGKYSFHGWTKRSSQSRHEVFEVDAGPDGDLERAMVRSMIELIRRYYKGDFNWESPRLDRVIVLSARLEDNAGLEDFLIKEFFSAGAGTRGQEFNNLVRPRRPF